MAVNSLGFRELAEFLARIDGLDVRRDEPLAQHARFGIGGPAALFVASADADALVEAVRLTTERGVPHMFLGEGSNVIASDDGYCGVIVRYLGDAVRVSGNRVTAEAGAPLQKLVTATVEAGLAGMHTLERIPGSVGGAVYGNAGAYGRQVDGCLVSARYFDGREMREIGLADCEFSYRESVFKRSKDRLILGCTLEMEEQDPAVLRAEAERIRVVRDEKFPPTMRCAGSIFKNLYLDDLPQEAAGQVPEAAVRGGKVASAYFLERVGAKGMKRGGIEIASYHANLIYNAGGGTAVELCGLIDELKARVADAFSIRLEEEVQYVGFTDRGVS